MGKGAEHRKGSPGRGGDRGSSHFEYPLPSTTAKAARSVREPSNFGLLFRRFLRYPRKWRIEPKRKFDSWQRDVVDASTRIFDDKHLDDLCKALRTRQKEMVHALSARGLASGEVRVAVAWRMAIGLGTPSVRETGISLDHLYGVPYIPGSAVKGVTRAYRLRSIAQSYGVPYFGPEEKRKWKKGTATPLGKLEAALTVGCGRGQDSGEKRRSLLAALKEDLDHTLPRLFGDEYQDLPREPIEEQKFASQALEFRQIFGSTDGEGCIIFFDAYPCQLLADKQSIVELDIINTHYQKYYTQEKPEPPADWHDPVPVYFLTVRAGTKFVFPLVARGEQLSRAEREALARKAESRLDEALRGSGVGAKTRSGYGDMTDPPPGDGR